LRNEFDNKESQFLKELRNIAGRPKLHIFEILEWAPTPLEAEEGQKIFFLPEAKIYVKIED